MQNRPTVLRSLLIVATPYALHTTGWRRPIGCLIFMGSRTRSCLERDHDPLCRCGERDHDPLCRCGSTWSTMPLRHVSYTEKRKSSRRTRVQEELNMIHYPRAAACLFTCLRAEESKVVGTMMSLPTTTKWQQRAPSWSTTLGLWHVIYWRAKKFKKSSSSRRAKHDPLP